MSLVCAGAARILPLCFHRRHGVRGARPDRRHETALARHPNGVRGFAVAGIPFGSPGMNVPGVKPQPYDIIAFGPAGQRLFARHGPS